MVGLERELQGCLCTGWDVIEIENPDNFYCGLEEIATQQTASICEIFIQETRGYGIEHKRLVEKIGR